MKICLNIGLERSHSDDGAKLSNGFILHTALEKAVALLPTCIHVEIKQSATEPTLIYWCELNVGGVPMSELVNRITRLAFLTHQDCIAALFVDDTGRSTGSLIGPRAMKWGRFDPQFFLVGGYRPPNLIMEKVKT